MSKVFHNAYAQDSGMPELSVLIPFFHDDPSTLLTSLLEQVDTAAGTEILIYDDGTADEGINSRLRALADSAPLPVTLIFAAQNKGRSAARNALVNSARADWVLFLDADMRPQTPQFLKNYLSEIRVGKADIIFGGFTVPSKKQSSATELHRVFSKSSDCLTAEQRRKAGPQYVCSSNLCVRKSVLAAEPFDTGFSGWGWEDSEWAARTSRQYVIMHADIPALHLGLESTETLLARFQNSGSNYMRFTQKHPELAKTLTLYKISQRLGHIPGQAVLRPLWSGLVRAHIVPTRIRLIALKLWRASWYAEAFKCV